MVWRNNPLITAASLKSYNHKDLAQMAKRRGVTGWHSMRKDQLVRALVKAAKTGKTTKSNGKASAKATGKASAKANGKTSVKANGKATAKANGTARKTAAKSKSPAKKKAAPKTVASLARAKAPARKSPVKKKPVPRKIERAHNRREKLKNLGLTYRNGKPVPVEKDRIVLLVRDSYWLHACWDLSRDSVERAKAAMAEHWHTAKPILRLLEVEAGSTTNTSERVARDIEIHGGVRNWYIDVIDPPMNYVIEIGYVAANGKFYALCRSNTVATPSPGSSDAMDENWDDVAENCEKVYAMSGGYNSDLSNGQLQELFEERLRRPMGSPDVTRFGRGAENMVGRAGEFEFSVESEMIVFGRTRPDAYVTLMGEPVKLRPDGSFTVRMDMPNRRQVIPAVAHSADGVEQHTVVLAVERNTKVMEPVVRDPNQ